MAKPKRAKPRIGAILKAARIELNMKAEDVGKALNVSRSRVYLWEADTYVYPKNFRGLSEVLHIPVEKLQRHNRKPH